MPVRPGRHTGAMAEVPVAVVSEDRLIPGAPETLWPLVSTGAGLRRWYAFGGASVDLRPGGALVLRWDEHGEFPATVTAVEAGRLLAFRWRSDGDSLVEIHVAAEGEGTRVTIRQSGRLADPELEAGAWRNSLELLHGLASDTS